MTGTKNGLICGALNLLLVTSLFAGCGGPLILPDGGSWLADADAGTERPTETLEPIEVIQAPPSPAHDAGQPPELSDAGEPPAPPETSAPAFDYAASLTADFAYRDSLPQTTSPESEWFSSSAYGPQAATYPPVVVPAEVSDPIAWKRDRVIEVAKHFLGVPYANLHVPIAGGLDCSNFTAWVYNYGFGLRFTSNTQKQAVEAGRKLEPGEALQKGDLLFIWNSSRTQIGHAAIFIDPGHIIDSTSSASPDGVGLRSFTGWYKERFAFARRIIE